MARKSVFQLEVAGPAVAGLFVALAGAFAVGPLGLLAGPLTTALLVAVRYYSQPK